MHCKNTPVQRERKSSTNRLSVLVPNCLPLLKCRTSHRSKIFGIVYGKKNSNCTVHQYKLLAIFIRISLMYDTKYTIYPSFVNEYHIQNMQRRTWVVIIFPFFQYRMYIYPANFFFSKCGEWIYNPSELNRLFYIRVKWVIHTAFKSMTLFSYLRLIVHITSHNTEFFFLPTHEAYKIFFLVMYILTWCWIIWT